VVRSLSAGVVGGWGGGGDWGRKRHTTYQLVQGISPWKQSDLWIAADMQHNGQAIGSGGAKIRKKVEDTWQIRGGVLAVWHIFKGH